MNKTNKAITAYITEGITKHWILIVRNVLVNLIGKATVITILYQSIK